ncbi:hypothetical protein GCM10022233_56480 [Streptomyces shaanxiensis]|uniref:Uncharacterized protein n=1 Tax=Streptomyces shaanxiensis TaxID=653357 RepID=A0ABP7VQI5_9ACTN
MRLPGPVAATRLDVPRRRLRRPQAPQPLVATNTHGAQAAPSPSGHDIPIQPFRRPPMDAGQSEWNARYRLGGMEARPRGCADAIPRTSRRASLTGTKSSQQPSPATPGFLTREGFTA